MKRKSLFTKTNSESRSTWQNNQPGNSELPRPWELYCRCDKLPLELFERCFIDSDLTALVIKGSPPSEEIASAWADVYSEWLDLNENTDGVYALTLQKEIILLGTVIAECETAIYCLSIIYDDRLVKVLTDNNIRCSIDPNNMNSYVGELEKCNNQLASLKFQKEMKESEYNDLVNSKQQNSVPKNYFDKWLTVIARFRRIAVIRKSEVTVKEFCMMRNDYIDYHKNIKQPKPSFE